MIDRLLGIFMGFDIADRTSREVFGVECLLSVKV